MHSIFIILRFYFFIFYSSTLFPLLFVLFSCSYDGLNNVSFLMYNYFFTLVRVHACLKQSVKADPVRPEFHGAVISWEFDNGKGIQG